MTVLPAAAVRDWWGLRPWRRHSLVLSVAGAVYILVGVVYVVTPLTDDRRAVLSLMLHWAPVQVWGFVWITAGVLSLISTRWPPPNETWGYTVLAALAAGWSAGYAGSILVEHAPTSGVSGVLVWGLLGFMWWAISGLRNPAPMPPKGG